MNDPLSDGFREIAAITSDIAGSYRLHSMRISELFDGDPTVEAQAVRCLQDYARDHGRRLVALVQVQPGESPAFLSDLTGLLSKAGS